ncbi:hypothetical protein ACFWFB_32910, partial [Streptomyces albidoflavus]
RLDLLRRTVIAERGEWTTARAAQLYADTFPFGIWRAAAHRDLVALHAEGLLVLNDDPTKRHYTVVSRRARLLVAIQQYGRPVTNQLAEQLLAGTPYATGRNTVRKGLRGLTRAGLLAEVAASDGRATYHPIVTTGEDGRS